MRREHPVDKGASPQSVTDTNPIGHTRPHQVGRAALLATATALRDAADDPDVAVVVLTGAGRAFSAGNDLKEMQAGIADGSLTSGGSHFTTMIDALPDLAKPLICAVNGVGVDIGTTILGYADLVFMSTTARLKCPFTSLGVAPEARRRICCPS